MSPSSRCISAIACQQRTAETVKVNGLSNVFEVAPVHVKLVEFVNPG